MGIKINEENDASYKANDDFEVSRAILNTFTQKYCYHIPVNTYYDMILWLVKVTNDYINI